MIVSYTKFSCWPNITLEESIMAIDSMTDADIKMEWNFPQVDSAKSGCYHGFQCHSPLDSEVAAQKIIGDLVGHGTSKMFQRSDNTQIFIYWKQRDPFSQHLLYLSSRNLFSYFSWEQWTDYNKVIYQFRVQKSQIYSHFLKKITQKHGIFLIWCLVEVQQCQNIWLL